jgi:membrane-associated phospholipid phosphatase
LKLYFYIFFKLNNIFNFTIINTYDFFYNSQNFIIMLKITKRIVLFLALLAGFTSCTETTPELKVNSENLTSNEDSKVAQEWINLYMVIEKDLPGFRPAATSRALGYIWIAAYEAGVPGMPNFISNSKKLNFEIPKLEKDVAAYDWSIAVNAALARSTNHFMHNTNPVQKKLIQDLETSENARLSKGVSAEVAQNSVNWGRAIADAVIAYSKTDLEAERQILKPFTEASQVPTPNVPGAWKGGNALFLEWGKTRAFASTQAQLLSPPPPAFSTNPSSTYYKDFYEVYDNVKNLNNERRWRAEFWSDDIVGLTFSPPARIFQIANQMIANENSNLEFSLHLLLKLGIAENDGAIAAWKSKYTYFVERPTEFIKDHIDKNFKTPLGNAIGTENITPPFPGYPSGHSTFGGLGISVLAAFFGENYTFTDRCHENRTEFNGYPRTYTTMTQIGEENAYSRIPLGVHPRFDCSEGLRLGKVIGTNAVNYKVTKF